jgi:hypothetical protein
LACRDGVLQHVGQREGAVFDAQDGGVARAAGRQVGEVGAVQQAGRGCGHGADDVGDGHAEGQELRHGDEVVIGRAVDAQHVNVGADDVGGEAGLQHFFSDGEGEGALAVADVEDHAALARLPDGVADAAVGVNGRVGERAEAVGQHVARAKFGQHVGVARRRVVDVAHHRQAGALGGLDRVV